MTAWNKIQHFLGVKSRGKTQPNNFVAENEQVEQSKIQDLPNERPVDDSMKKTSSKSEELESNNLNPVVQQMPGYQLEHPSCVATSLHFLWETTLARLNHFFGRTTSFQLPEFTLPDDGSSFAKFVIEKVLKVEDFLLVLTALAPHAHPNFFSQLVSLFLPKGGEFPEFGGVKGTNARSLLPTGETALFLLSGLNLDSRFARQSLFSENSFLIKEQIISLEPVKDGEPELSGRLILAKEYVELFLTGQEWKPRFSGNFPAKRIITAMEWEDLIVSTNTMNELLLIKKWLRYDKELRKDETLKKKLKPGFRALFYGPPGTGKTLTATLLGKEFEKDVYRIDLSMVISKYIGETEKNLSTVFETAANKDWILFFDEADALFGKRTNISNAHDRYANQEVSYLLQRVEDHDGLVILATNFKNNIDSAFMRRFHTSVYFQMPTVAERKLLWQSTLPQYPPLSEQVSVEELAQKFELSGAGILNVIQLAGIRALSEDRAITRADLIEEIRKEYDKEGKTF